MVRWVWLHGFNIGIIFKGHYPTIAADKLQATLVIIVSIGWSTTDIFVEKTVCYALYCKLSKRVFVFADLEIHRVIIMFDLGRLSWQLRIS